ncbi:MAG: ThuA domain-containing protein [Gillisia sp.]|nr:ThuA domain-containing protein [Gillisia sp.]
MEGGGKSIYTGGGHTEKSYLEPAFQEHLLQFILFALEGKK